MSGHHTGFASKIEAKGSAWEGKVVNEVDEKEGLVRTFLINVLSVKLSQAVCWLTSRGGG